MLIVIKPKINIDAAGIAMKIHKAAQEAMPKLTETILEDCNEYAPERSGNLIESSNINHHAGGVKATLRWEAKYSGYVYKGISKSGKSLKYTKQPNANAQSHWCRKAKQMKLVEWNKLAGKYIKENYSGKA